MFALTNIFEILSFKRERESMGKKESVETDFKSEKKRAWNSFSWMMVNNNWESTSEEKEKLRKHEKRFTENRQPLSGKKPKQNEYSDELFFALLHIALSLKRN